MLPLVEGCVGGGGGAVLSSGFSDFTSVFTSEGFASSGKEICNLIHFVNNLNK